MSDVKARLAAVRTEYAPHGWSDTTSGGFEIVFACDDEFGGVAGIVKNHGMHAVTWDGDGVIEDDEADDCSNWNLVPLPAPVAVQDEQPDDIDALSDSELSKLLRLYEEDTEKYYTVSKLIAERRKQCPPVQKLATSGPSITRPVPAVDAWVTYGQQGFRRRWRVSSVETVDGETRLICGASSIPLEKGLLTGPSDRGPWRPIGEVR